MLSHLILGLLRDGRARHGYDLISEYRQLSGSIANPGNFYRELRNLAEAKLVTPEPVAPDEDQRRIPYRITVTGTAAFDQWLCSSTTPQEELSSWLLFADRIAPQVLCELLDATRDQLWLQSKTLEHARSTLRNKGRQNGDGRSYQPALRLLLWQLKRVTADLDFLDEFRREIEARPTDPKGGSRR
jgi:DNA-binding PadR family transcriptional regulator